MPGEEQKTLKSESKSKSKSKTGRLVVVIAILSLGAAGIWFWVNQGSDAAASAAPRVRSTLHLETFVLNLADADQRSYLRVGIDLGLNQVAKHGEELAPVGQVRDAILGVLAEAKVDELMTAAGKTKLKENLLHALQERVPRIGVEEVYFTEFLIQR